MRRACLLLSLSCLSACEAPTAPLPLPDGAREYVAPPVYTRWWAATAACASRSIPTDRIRWYVVPGDSIQVPTGGWAAGYYDEGSDRIVLASSAQFSGGTVRHEMLHALLGRGVRGHPPRYFQDRCGGWVTCAERGCADEGPFFPLPAANAPVLQASEVEVLGEVLPSGVTRTPDDTGAFVIVRVRNPRREAVWVELADPVGCGPQCPIRGWFGYGVVSSPPFTDGLSQGELEVTERKRFALPPGGSRIRVFDVGLEGYRSGSYVARVFFNPADYPRLGTGAADVPFQILK